MIVRGLLVALSLSAWAGAASADPKDDVLNAMVKCAGVSGKSARLDCFDRATPGLRALFDAPGVADAAPVAPPPPAVAAPAPSGAPPSPAAVASTEPAEQKKSWFGLNFGGRKGPQTTPAEFGSERLPAPESAAGAAPPKDIDEIEARVTDYATNALGKSIVFLDNGQIWRQMDSDSAKLRFSKNPSENTVAIKRGAFGSYSMIVNKHGALAKVERTK